VPEKRRRASGGKKKGKKVGEGEGKAGKGGQSSMQAYNTKKLGGSVEKKKTNISMG